MPCEEKQWSSYKMDSAVITDLEAQPSDETDASAANLHGTVQQNTTRAATSAVRFQIKAEALSLVQSFCRSVSL